MSQQQHVRPREGESSAAVSVQERKPCPMGSTYLYAGPGRKPQLLMQLESFVSNELHFINPDEPKYQELRLQVYREVFARFIKAFQTYQPLLSDIRKEYENTFAYQQQRLQELEPLRSHLRVVTAECDRKIQARWAEEQAEIRALRKEKQRLQEDVKAMREKEKTKQAVVDHLQSELLNQYLQHNANKLLIRQLSDLTRCNVKDPADEGEEEDNDPVTLQLALKVCRNDLTKASEELNRIKAEYWDVVPRHEWENLEQMHKSTLLQLGTLQRDFDQLKSEYDTLLELNRTSDTQADTLDPDAVQEAVGVSQEQMQIESNQPTEPIQSDASSSDTMTVQEFRAALRKAFPLKSDQEIDELVSSAQSEPDSSGDIISSQKLHSLIAESSVADLPPSTDECSETAVSNI